MRRRQRSTEQAASPSRTRERSKSITSDKFRKSAKLKTFVLWSARVITCTSRWLTRELCGVLEDRGITRNAPAEDPMKFIPSVVSFVVCIFIAHQFSQSLEAVISKCLALMSSIMNAVLSLTEVFSWHDIEATMSGVFIVLFWIGAFRIVSSTFSKIVVLSKLRACNYGD